MNMDITQMLTMLVLVLIGIIIVLVLVYLAMKFKENNKKDEKTEIIDKTEPKPKTKGPVTYTKLSVFDFMQFDKVEDNMVIQDGGARYLMAIECDGINYDLMSEVEKTSVEAGFVQFLNTLRHPIQIYTQTRNLNIDESIKNYTNKIDEIRMQLLKKQNQLEKLIDEEEEFKKIQLEIVRLQNLYEYGYDVVENIKKTSHNKNVLRKHYYVIVPYYAEELGNDLLGEDEKREMVFSELYTRAQAIARTLYSSGVKTRVLDSSELSELLYMAYNRDEAEVYGVRKAIESGYSELYSTAPDVLDKKMKAINKKIETEAVKLANEAINDVRSEKKRKIKEKEERMDKLIEEMAAALVEENKMIIGKKVAEDAINKITGNKTKEEEEVKNEEKQVKKTRKPRTTKSK